MKNILNMISDKISNLREKIQKAEKKEKLLLFLCFLVFLAVAVSAIILGTRLLNPKKTAEEPEEMIESVVSIITEPESEEETDGTPQILPEYKELYAQNNDMIGWLKIEDTVIDYPVMQTPEDENFYLKLGFDKKKDERGCLIMDTDSTVGDGTADYGYNNGTKPSSNLIIHGHTMKNGEMFGNLKKYEEEKYGKEHHIIKFDSLYEHREYELIAVFYSQVFYEDEDVFKYYKFFQADTQEEFDDWYDNIKKMSVYDTGVTADLGDEFITLSSCAYHVEDGRFVVVGKRIK